MRLLHGLVFSVLIGTIPVLGLGLRAPGPVVTFHTIGDLPGGYEFSTVRDATKVGNVIYAVGGSAIRTQVSCVTVPGPGCFQPNALGADTPILWTQDVTDPTNLPPPTLTALPNLDTSNTSNQTGMLAQAITTPDASYIASIAHDLATGASRVATRVATNGLATVNLNAAPYTVFTSPTSSASAQAISDDGLLLSGNLSIGDVNRAAWFNVQTQTSDLIPLNPGQAVNGTVARGMSFNGSVIVGFSAASGASVTEAFRYLFDRVTNTGTLSAIPRLPGGTTNRPLAVSKDGNVTLLSGNSAALPNGAIYVYDTTVPASPVITNFGSPNTAWLPGVSGGITADGSVATVNYLPPGGGNQFSGRYAYFHNSQGWFHFEAALGAGGIDVLNLSLKQLVVNGISPDGTLVYGQGLRDTAGGPVIEGFVAEFPAGFLASFDVPAVPPANPAIVGAWYAADTSASALADPTTANPVIIVFLADGSFFHVEANVPASPIGGANGFERGRYRWNGASTGVPGAFSGAFSLEVLQDTNGDVGVSGLAGVSVATADVVGDTLTIALPGCESAPDPTECSLIATRVTGAAFNPPVGAWFGGNPLVDDNSVLLVLLQNGDYYFAQDGSSEPPPAGDPNGRDGIEKGTWAWNQASGDFSSWTTVDTNGEWGLNSTFPLAPSPGNPNFVFTLTLSPDGLRFDASAGSESFSFNRVAVISTATPVGTNVVVEPTSPTGSTPVTIQFEEITGGGETTLQVIDPSSVPAALAPPAGFSLGDPPLYYEIDTTATFTGPVTVCFNYAGVTFASGTPRLLHFDEDLQSWVDITATVDAATTTICGITSSFSPFAIAASQATTSGFAAPISPVGSYQNAVKGGSTVPLKFNVYVNGVEKTDTSGLTFSVVQVACVGDAGETAVEFLTTGGTSLRYGGGQFVQNWKTPTAPGCYFVRVTGDGLLLSALFRVK